MIDVPEMFMVGSAGRNVGKTEFACELIRRFSSVRALVGVKVTTINNEYGSCPRGGDGCGVCTSLEGSYCITDEINSPAGKDTGRLLAAGAEKVYWLRVRRDKMAEGFTALQAEVGSGALLVCESNSLRELVVPGVFLMVSGKAEGEIKPSAASVKGRADVLLTADMISSFDWETITLDSGQWKYMEKVNGHK